MKIDIDTLKPILVERLLRKTPQAEDLERLKIIVSLEGGKSGALVLHVDSALGVSEIEGQSVLKITLKSSYPNAIAEDARYRQSEPIKKHFAELLWSELIGVEGKEYQFSFWRWAPDRVPEAEVQPWSALERTPKKQALSQLCAALLSANPLQNPKEMNFRAFCERVLGYRLLPFNGRLYAFMQQQFKASIHSPLLHWKQLSLPDPYYYARHSTSTLERVYTGVVHGDLHTGNIFAVLHNDQSLDPLMIDAGLVEREHPLFYDHAYLEVSLLINSDVAKSNDETHWQYLFERLCTFNFEVPEGPFEPYRSVFEHILSIRQSFSDFINTQSHHGISAYLSKQYHLQRVCTALNYCNKSIASGTQQRRFAYLYAAFQLRAFIHKYGDDPDISALYQQLKRDRDYLQKLQLEKRRAYDYAWKRLAETEPTSLYGEDLKLLHQEVTALAPYNRFPRADAQRAIREFLSRGWHQHLFSQKSIADTFAFLSLWSTACGQSFLSLSQLLSPEAQAVLRQSFLALEPSLVLQDSSLASRWLQFSLLILQEAVVQQDQALFSTWEECIDRFLTQLSATETKVDSHGFYYLKSLNQVVALNAPLLQETLKQWQPENDDYLCAEWLIKKSFLMAACFDENISTAYRCLEKGFQYLDYWPYQEQVYFLEAAQYMRQSFRYDAQLSPEEEHLKHLKYLGFKGLKDEVDYFENRIFVPEPRQKPGITYYFADPVAQAKHLSMRLLMHFVSSGLQPCVWNVTFTPRAVWQNLHAHLFEQHPQICLFYAFSYMPLDYLDAKWVRQQITRYYLEGNLDAESLYRHLAVVYHQLKTHDSRYHMLLIAVLSDFIPYLPEPLWIKEFNCIWAFSHLPKNQEILYSQTKQGPFFFLYAALPKLTLAEDIVSCRDQLLLSDNDLDADVYIRPQLLAQLADNPRFEKSEVTPVFLACVKHLIDEVAHVNTAYSALVRLRTLDPLLQPEHFSLLSQAIQQLSHLPSIAQVLYHLIHYTRHDEIARKHLHELIIKEGERLWPHGVVKSDADSFKRHILVHAVLPLHAMKAKPTFLEGLKFSDAEILQIYGYLKSALAVFKQSRSGGDSGKLADSKHLLGRGLGFSLLKEMHYFLQDYRAILDSDTDYEGLESEIMDGIQAYEPSSGTPVDLISENPNTVSGALNRVQDFLKAFELEQLGAYWFTLLSKVLTGHQPQLEESLDILAYWLAYYRDESFFQEKAYVKSYIQILERYKQNYPEEESNERFEFHLVKISQVLEAWQEKAPVIAYFLETKSKSAYASVRDLKPIAAHESYDAALALSARSLDIDFSQLNINDFKLKSIGIQGFKSISHREMQSIDIKNFNVMIGANGVGKSSVLSFFKLLQAFAEQPLDSYSQRTNVSELFYYGLKETPLFSGRVKFKHTQGELNYAFSCVCSDDGKRLLFKNEVITFIALNQQSEHIKQEQADASLMINLSGNPLATLLKKCLKRVFVFHVHDTSPQASSRKASSIQIRQIGADGTGLAGVIYALKESSDNEGYMRYKRITRAVQWVFPQFDDFVFQVDERNQTVALEWQEKGSDHRFSITQASDGTLRFMALVTLLYQFPEHLPGYLILDEPELGLHPEASSFLATLLSQNEPYTQTILATQSTDLLNEFEADDILVVNRKYSLLDDGTQEKLAATTLERKSTEQLAEWLEDYSLGELWDKNVLGGKP